MGCPDKLRPDMAVTDLAYCILKTRGQPFHFKELISEIVRIKEWNPANSGKLLAQIHTEINLDSRFQHLGGGEWGLRDWQPRAAKVVRIRPQSETATARPRFGGDDDDDDDDDDLGELGEPVDDMDESDQMDEFEEE